MVDIGARVQNPTILVNGSPLRDALFERLVDLRIDTEIQLPGSFSMRFRDPVFEVLDSKAFNIGTAVSIAFPTSSGSDAVVFVGEITALAVDQGAGNRHELIVSGLDAAHRLAHGSVPATYLNVSLPDVLSQVASRHGLQAACTATSARFPHIVQTTSDYAFTDELARRMGADWWVEDKKLHVAPRKKGSPIALTWGADLQRFKVRFSGANQTASVTVRGWNSAEQKAIVAKDGGAAKSPSAVHLGTDAPLGATSASARTKLNGFSVGAVATAVRAASAAEATKLADALALEAVGTAVMARGEALGRPELRVGRMAEVKDMGASLSGEYLVTEVCHVWGAGKQLTTRFSSGAKRPSGIVDLLGGATGLGNPFAVPLIGVVTNITDPDNLGRVKVKLPTLGDDVETDWARLASPGAGNQVGLLLAPEPGEEVLVAFESGDARFPVVLGGLWSRKHQLPAPSSEVIKGGKTKKGVIKSRKGHVIELGDGDGPADQHVLIKLANGTKFRLGADKVTLEVANGKPLELKAGQGSIVISDRGDITITGNNVAIKANQRVTIDANTDLALTSKTNLKMAANAKAELTGNATTTVAGNGMLELKGGMVKIN